MFSEGGMSKIMISRDVVFRENQMYMVMVEKQLGNQ